MKIVATSGCTLADTNYVGQTEIDTPAFQQYASLNVWTPVAVITNSSRTPTITFSYASGGSNRWYMDEVRFENLPSGTATPARITQILYSNTVIIAGTGPDKQIQLALFLVSSRSNHISGKLIHISDDWRRLESSTLSHAIFSLRRLTRS